MKSTIALEEDRDGRAVVRYSSKKAQVTHDAETLAGILEQVALEDDNIAVKVKPDLSWHKPVAWPKTVPTAALAKGVRVESEHTSDARTSAAIALDHLAEDFGYYTKLAKVEGGRPDADRMTASQYEDALVAARSSNPRKSK